MKILSRLTVVLFGLFISGCSLAPEYTRPELPVADQLPVDKAGKPPGDLPQQSGPELGWRGFFTDPQLQALIELALANNRDLRESALTVEAYQAQYRIQRSALFPTIMADGSGSKQRTMTGSGDYGTSEMYSASVGIAAYELDLFGRVRHLRDQALEQYLAMEESHRSVHISLVAEVARAYFTWLADRELLRVTEDTLRIEEESFQLIEQREREGVATQLDLAQARTSLETARANLALYERLVAQDGNDLSLLAGSTVPVSLLEKAAPLNEQQLALHLPSPLASSVLLQRPDVMSAEHELKGAHADIGAARAAFFPAISLTAAGGFASDDLSRLFGGNSGIWSFAPSISLPIFTAGRLQAQLDVAEIRKDMLVAQYEKAIQTAFQETANTLVARATYVRQLAAQRANLQANQEYHELARNRYQHGLDSFLTLLDAQRSLYTARQRCLTVYLEQLLNQVSLYKALGGGWEERS